MSSEINQAARMLYENIKADINNAGTRLEHVRLTALAQEAENLVALLDNESDDNRGESTDEQ